MASNEQQDIEIIDTNETAAMDDDSGTSMSVPDHWGTGFEREDTHPHPHTCTANAE